MNTNINHINWPEIEGFHNVLKYMKAKPELLGNSPEITYKFKVKLHGFNAGIQLLKSSGDVVAQSRTAILSPKEDKIGFGRWIEARKENFLSVLENKVPQDLILFGEFCGPGIMKNVAISKIPNKSFMVFSAKILSEDHLITEPEVLWDLVQDIPDVYTIPWFEIAKTQAMLNINWLSNGEKYLQDIANEINFWVNQVEKEDPWVKEMFKISGTGEGLVAYPDSVQHLGFENFSMFAFKAKGEAHRVVKQKEAVQIAPEKANSIDNFISMVLPAARLHQGVLAVGNSSEAKSLDKKLTGKFVNWIVNDVKKETMNELEASSLSWDEIIRPLSDYARKWYLSNS